MNSRPFPPREKARAAFGKGVKAGSFKSKIDADRRTARQVQDEEHLGVPPDNPNLFQARLVIPGKHMLPRGLDEPTALNDIRQAHKAYITNVEPNVLDIRCETITGLQKAVKAINWAIHGLRLSNDHPIVRFLVQEPTNADADGVIAIELGKRPCFTSRSSILCDNSTAMDVALQRLPSELATSAEALRALTKDVKMRVNFAHLVVDRKKKGSQSEMTYPEFVKLMNVYSERGGARFPTALANPSEAERLLQYLCNADQGICGGREDMLHAHEVTLVVDDIELKTDILGGNKPKPTLSSPRVTKPEAWGRLNWTVAAPDMNFDWNLRIDAWEKGINIPLGFEGFEKKLVVTPGKNSSRYIQIPQLSTLRLGDLMSRVSQTRLRSSVKITFKDTPYILEVSVTKVWNGGRTTTEPEVSWGIEFYGVHWDEGINYVSAGERRKDWGEGLVNIWSGSDPSLGVRFGDFIRTVLQVQAVLNGAGSFAAAP
ncbi:hypothetical protein G7046_g7645 [Stylonectria norvegica]|nr:hypothetical protein G7046_g7645 [Stylonectria norvegica]